MRAIHKHVVVEGTERTPPSAGSKDSRTGDFRSYHQVRMFMEQRSGFGGDTIDTHHHTFGSGKFHRRNEVGIVGDEDKDIDDAFRRHPRYVESDFHIHTFLAEHGRVRTCCFCRSSNH